MAGAAHCHATSNESPAVGGTAFAVLASSPRWRASTTTEASVQLKYHVAGLFTKLIALVLSNTTTGNSMVDFRKNGVSGSSSITIGAGATGTFEDLVHADAIVANDLVNLRVVAAAGGTLGIQQLGMLYKADSVATVSKLAMTNANGFGTPSTTFFFPIIGGTDVDTEARYQLRIPGAYTARFHSVHVGSNTRSDTSTMRTRVNGANGAQSFTVGAGATGLFEDATNTDSLVLGDLFATSTTLGAGTGSLGPIVWAAEFTDELTYSTIWGNSQDITVWGAGVTEYISPFGAFTTKSVTETNVQFLTRLPVLVSQAYIFVMTNATSSSSTFRVRKNGADTPLSITVGAGVTGAFSNTINSVEAGAADLLAWQGIIGATGGINLSMLNMRAQDFSPLVLAGDDDGDSFQIRQAP